VTVRVLLCDDQALVRSGFRMVLEAREDMEVVGEAENGADALQLAARCRPDVILMDVRMPVMDGVEATRRLARTGTRARIVILTTFDSDEYVYEALRAGASGFLLKDVQPAQLVDAVRVVARGEALLAPTVTRRLLDRFSHTLPDSSRTAPAAAFRRSSWPTRPGWCARLLPEYEGRGVHPPRGGPQNRPGCRWQAASPCVASRACNPPPSASTA
jgi:DNA-binding NarL/FixJ family response regulator